MPETGQNSDESKREEYPFNLILPAMLLKKLLNDEAIYARIGPYTFFMQLENDTGRDIGITSVAEFRASRGEIHEWHFKHVAPLEDKDE